MKVIFYVVGLAFFMGSNSCSVLRESPKYKLQDGFYKSNIGGKSKSIYVDNNDTIINIYLATKNKMLFNLDSLPKSSLSLPQQSSPTIVEAHNFNKTSFDIDILTFPFKYRPAKKNLPNQFNTILNGAVYTGFRNDIFKIKYNKNPKGKFDRESNHYGFSYGVFNGLGGTLMNPSSTDGAIDYEYDGVVWTKGLAGIIAVNNFTVGIAVGLDNLLDHNHTVWNYQQKPWIGVALGLNLN